MTKCKKCNDSIKPAMIAVTVAGKEYHPACVSCCRCDRSLWGKDYTRTKQGLLCERACTPHGRPQSSQSTRPPPQLEDPNWDEDVKINVSGINKKGNTGASRYQNTAQQPSFNNDRSPRTVTTPISNRPQIRQATATLAKHCNKCKQSVLNKKYITFEDGEVVCQNCNAMSLATPRPKSAHMILCSICNKTVKGMRYFTEPDGTTVCTLCDVRGARCFKCKNLFKFNQTPCIVQNPSIPGTGIQLHQECFNCESCTQPLEINNYFQDSDTTQLPICPDCHRLSQPIPSPRPRQQKTNNFPSNDQVQTSQEPETETTSLCIKCSTPIIGPCLIVENQPIHHDCFTCAHCKTFLNTETGFYKNGQNQAICYECDLVQSSVLKCAKCLGPISEMNGVQFRNKSYHPECYACVECNVNLATMKRPMTDNEYKHLFCETCWIKGIAPKCTKCSEPIYPPHKPGTVHEGKHYHLRCFACHRCKKTLADKKFFKAGNLLKCETCF